MNSNYQNEEKDRRTVYVGNIPYNLGTMQLSDNFKELGYNVDFVSVPKNKEDFNKRNRGFCFLVLKSEDDVDSILQAGNILMEGRTLRIKRLQ